MDVNALSGHGVADHVRSIPISKCERGIIRVIENCVDGETRVRDGIERRKSRTRGTGESKRDHIKDTQQLT